MQSERDSPLCELVQPQMTLVFYKYLNFVLLYVRQAYLLMTLPQTYRDAQLYFFLADQFLALYYRFILLGGNAIIISFCHLRFMQSATNMQVLN